MAGASKREFAAELLGTFVLMIFGLGVNAQVALGDRDYGDFFTINAGWGVAVALAVYVSGGITGGHINPAVTIALAVYIRNALGPVQMGIWVILQVILKYNQFISLGLPKAVVREVPYQKGHGDFVLADRLPGATSRTGWRRQDAAGGAQLPRPAGPR